MRCFEDRADPPLNKENANFCDFFTPKKGAFKSQSEKKSPPAKQPLESLFSADESDPAAPADGNDRGLAPAEEGQLEPSGPAKEGKTPAEPVEPLSKETLARKKLDDLFGR